MPTRIFALTLSLIFSFESFSFSVSHPDCRMRIRNFTKDNQFLKSLFLDKLKERNYTVDYMVDNKRVISGELYIELIMTRIDNLIYDDCRVKLEMKQAKGNVTTATDKVLFKKETTRKLPRVTFKGDERCTRALKDAFVHIPRCKKQQ